MNHNFGGRRIATTARLAAFVSMALLLGLAGCSASMRSTVDLTPRSQEDPGPPKQLGDPNPSQNQQPGQFDQPTQPPPPTEPPHHGIGHRMLFWIPNRIFDVLDLVRARVRLGPGWTFSARATELVDINMGTHATFFVGLHGPRSEPKIPWPVGLETFSGLEFSVADATAEEAPRGPKYGMLECGVGFQVLLVGVDIGVDVGEALDFVAGIILWDPFGDDF